MRHLVTLCVVFACGRAVAGSSTGTASPALDFEVVQRSADAFVVRDQAYEITLPSQPTFKSATGLGSVGVTVAAKLGGDSIVFTATVMPPDSKLDVEGVAVDVIGKMGAKLQSNTAATFGGLPGRKVLGTGTYAGKPFQAIEYVALDTKHHTLVSIADVSEHSAAPAFDAARKSFTIKSGPAPHAVAGVALDKAEFVSKPGRFAVEFPGKPVEETKDSDANGVHFHTVTNTVKLAEDRKFIVTYSDFSARTGALDDSSYVSRGKLISRKVFKLFGHPAHDLEVALPQDHILRVRLVDLGGRIYQILVIMPSEFAHATVIDAFFTSFRITT